MQINLKESDIRKNRRENHFTESFIALDKSGYAIVDLRIYRTNALTSVVVWITPENGYGVGSARNYSLSATIIDAFENAGIVFDKDLGGCQAFAIVELVAKFFMGDKFLTVIHAHA